MFFFLVEVALHLFVAMPNIVRSPLATTSTSCRWTMLRSRRAASPPATVSPPCRCHASAAPAVQRYSYAHSGLPLLLPQAPYRVRRHRRSARHLQTPRAHVPPPLERHHRPSTSIMLLDIPIRGAFHLIAESPMTFNLVRSAPTEQDKPPGQVSRISKVDDCSGVKV